MKRQTANRAILTVIASFIEEFPDLRFGQILYLLDLIRQDENGQPIDVFNDEPDVILKRMDEKLSKLIEEKYEKIAANTNND